MCATTIIIFRVVIYGHAANRTTPSPSEVVYYNYYYCYYLCKGISRVFAADEVKKLLKYSELDGQKYSRPSARATIIYYNNNKKKPLSYVRRTSEWKHTRKDAVKFIRITSVHLYVYVWVRTERCGRKTITVSISNGNGSEASVGSELLARI